MNERKIKAGMVVDCLGTRLGTVRQVSGEGDAQMLEVQPANGPAGAALLQIPFHHAVQVLGDTVLLDSGCAEAQGQGWPTAPQPAVARASTPGRAAAALTDLAPGQSLTVPIVEETLVPVTRWQEAGAVEIRKHVRVETQELDVPVRHEEATLERVPVNRVLAEGEVPAPHQEGDTLVVPVVQEELVVMTRRVLVEEIRITKQVRTTTRHFAEPVRREEVEIAHPGLDPNPAEDASATSGT